MNSPARVSGLLSQVLVAFAIEFDNEFESRMAKTWARPFRVSIVMWSNFMRFVREEGAPFEEIVAASHIPKARSRPSSAGWSAGGTSRSITTLPAEFRPVGRALGRAAECVAKR